MSKKSAAVFFLIILWISSACAGSSTPSSPNPEPIIPTNTSDSQAAHPTPTSSSDPGYGEGYGIPVQNPTPPTASVVLPEIPNQAYFQDYLATADMFVVNISDVPPAPVGQVYQGWIRNEDGSLINAGILVVPESGKIHLEWMAPDGRNLIASIIGFAVSLTAAPGSDQLSGTVAFAGEMSPEQITLARNLFVTNTAEPVTPRNKAFALALVQQMGLASAHVDNSLNAEAIGAFNERALHLEHVINIIEGSKGERFKDYNGDGSTENPGDGFGVMAYAGQLARQLNLEDVTSKTQVFLVALLDIEQKVIAILDGQPEAISLTDLRTQFDGVYNNLLVDLYRLSEQAIAFKILPISSP